MFLAVLVISTDNYTPLLYIDFVECTVSAELLQTFSQPHSLISVSTIILTRSERQPEIYGLCASDLEAVLKPITIKKTTL